MKMTRLSAHQIARFLAVPALFAALAGCAADRHGETPIAVTTATRITAPKPEDSIVVIPDPHPDHPGPHQTSIVITTKGAAIDPKNIDTLLWWDKHHVHIHIATKDPFEPKPKQ